MIPLQPNLLEEGSFLSAAQRLVRGERMYRDIVYFTGPLPFEALALLFRWFGEEVMVARMATVVLHGAATGSVYALARRSVHEPLAHLVASVVAATPILLFPFYSIYFYSAIAFHLSLFAALATLCAVRSNAWAVGAGVLIACIALCKQNVGVYLAVAMLGSLAVLAPAAERVRRTLAMAVGGALVAVMTLAVFGVRGDLGVLVDQLVVLPLSLGDTFDSPFPNLWPPGEFTGYVRRSDVYYVPYLFAVTGEIYSRPLPAWIILLTQILYALPLVAVGLTLLRRLAGPLPPGVWLHFALVVVLTLTLFPRVDWGHIVYVLPVAVVQLVLLGPSGPGRRRASSWAAVPLMLLVAGGAWATGATLYGHAGPATYGPRVPQLPVTQTMKEKAVPRVIHYLRQHARRGEPIFVARAEPLIYFATDTRNPTPYFGLIPGIEAQERNILSALEDVRFVVMSEIDQDKFLYYRDEAPAVQAYLERHFFVAPEFRTGTGNWLIVLRRGRDRGPTAIDLFERRAEGRPWVRSPKGRIVPVTEPVPRIANRLNRRPLASWITARGGGIDFGIDVPHDAVFGADVGMRSLAGRPVRVWQSPDIIATVSVGRKGVFEALASRPVLSKGQVPRAWYPIEADLAAYAGERVTLRLEFSAHRLLEDGMAWWGSPRIAVRNRSESR
jgi:hypothetical protein